MVISNTNNLRESKVNNIRALKDREKLVMLTCYDFQMAKDFFLSRHRHYTCW